MAKVKMVYKPLSKDEQDKFDKSQQEFYEKYIKYRKENIMDKLAKVRVWIQTRKLCTMDEHMKFYCKEAESEYKMLSCIEEVIDSLQKEPVSDDLDKEMDNYLASVFNERMDGGEPRFTTWFKALQKTAIHFANWQKEQMMSKAIDGEVGYWNLHGLSVNVELPSTVEEGDKVKVIVIKEG